MPYSRARIRIETHDDLMSIINDARTSNDSYIVEDFSGTQRVCAKSVMGMLYAMSDFNNDMYLVNLTNDGKFPSFVDKYRVGGN